MSGDGASVWVHPAKQIIFSRSYPPELKLKIDWNFKLRLQLKQLLAGILTVTPSLMPHSLFIHCISQRPPTINSTALTVFQSFSAGDLITPFTWLSFYSSMYSLKQIIASFYYIYIGWMHICNWGHVLCIFFSCEFGDWQIEESLTTTSCHCYT